MSRLREFLIDFKETFIRLLGSRSGEGNIGMIGAELTRNLREKAIGKTVYRIRSVFEGKKDIDETLERLAVKNAVVSEDKRNKNTSE